MLDRRRLRALIETIVENLLRIIFFWCESEKEFGEWVIRLHYGIWITLLSVFIVMRIVTIPFIIICAMFLLSCIMWTQHLVLGVCLLSSIQKRVLGRQCKLINPLLELFDIPVSRESIKGVTILLSTIFVSLMILEISNRLISQ